MLQLYTDLRRYISSQEVLKENTYGWYVKQICEYARNESIVKSLLDGFKTALENDYGPGDYYLFDGLFSDFHVYEALDTDEVIMLRLIISCFVNDFILEMDYDPMEWQYLAYTKTGREINGVTSNVLSEYLEIAMTDFSHLCNWDGEEFTKDEIIDGLIDGSITEIFEEVSMVSGILVIDENEEYKAELEEILEMFGFEEVVPGLYYYGCAHYAGSENEFGYISRKEAKEIMDIISLAEKQRDLDDEYFLHLNSDLEYAGALEFIKKLEICTSNREVMF